MKATRFPGSVDYNFEPKINKEIIQKENSTCYKHFKFYSRDNKQKEQFSINRLKFFCVIEFFYIPEYTFFYILLSSETLTLNDRL